MSIKKLIDAIDKPNLIKSVLKRDDGDEILLKLGSLVVKNHLNNEQSMNEWSDLIESGMEIAKFENKGASYPWDGAANFKSPMITEAVRAFGDRAKTEIMKSDELVTTKIVGKEDDQKKESSERITEHMNWQINTEMKGWRTDQTKLMYLIASQGAVFKKTYYDATEGCNKSEMIRYPNFSLDQECSNLLNANFTEIKHYYKNDVFEHVQAGLWFEDEDKPIIQDGEDLEDECFEFLTQHCNYDLDDDGYEEPLMVTVHRQSNRVVRITAMWDLDSLHVKYNGNTYKLDDLITGSTRPNTQDDEFNAIQANEKMDDIQRKATLVRIVPLDMITYYGFIESTDGSFLSLGYLHVLSSTTKGVNKATNSLFNSGELANLQGGWLSKEHRDRKSGPFRVKPGSFKQTNMSAQNLSTSIFPLQFKEPSQTLLQLTQMLKDESKQMTAQFNHDQVLSPNVPAASVLGVLQEGIIPTASLLMNVVTAMSHEFKILFTLNQKFTDPLIYQTITESDDYAGDYGQDIQINPTANAQFSSQMQKIQLAEAQMARLDVLLQVGGNPVPVVKSYYEALGTQNMDDIFPEQMTDEDTKVQKQMLQAQTAQTEAMSFQNELLKAQVDQGNQKLETDRMKAEADIAEARRESERKDMMLLEELKKVRAETLLKFEEAQTEDTKNNHKMQMDQLDMLIKLTGPSKSSS